MGICFFRSRSCVQSIKICCSVCSYIIHCYACCMKSVSDVVHSALTCSISEHQGPWKYLFTEEKLVITYLLWNLNLFTTVLLLLSIVSYLVTVVFLCAGASEIYYENPSFVFSCCCCTGISRFHTWSEERRL
jgi:hypothetical protein